MAIDLNNLFQRKQISLRDAAEKTGLPEARLLEIVESQNCSLRELRIISRKLRIPLSRFANIEHPDSKLDVLLRASPNLKFSELGDSQQDVISLVAGLVEIESPEKSDTDWRDKIYRVARDDSPKAMAKAFRQVFIGDELSPLSNLPQILTDKLQINILIRDLFDLEGASVRTPGNDYIFLSPRSFLPRMLFTLAHELGHLLANHHSSDNFRYNFDLPKDLTRWSKSSKKFERYANEFASNFLAPDEAVIRAFKAIRELDGVSGPIGDVEILYASRFFNVGFEVMSLRLEELEFLPVGGGRSLYEMLKKNFASPERRADELSIPERDLIHFPLPIRLIKKSLIQIEKGKVSVGEVADLLSISVEQIYSEKAELSE